MSLSLGGYPRYDLPFPEPRSLSVLPAYVYAVLALASDNALPACVGAVFHSLSPGTSVVFATFATVPPLSGRPLHSNAAEDTAVQMVSCSPSGGKGDAAGAVALVFSAIVLDALVGPKEVLAPVRSSLGWEILVPVRGAFINDLSKKHDLSPSTLSQFYLLYTPLPIEEGRRGMP